MPVWTAQLRRGLVDLCLLAAIGTDEVYGYQLVERLGRYAGLELTESTIYPALARLARERALKVRRQASPEGPARRYYCLTPEGHIRLAAMTADWRTLVLSLQELTKGVSS